MLEQDDHYLEFDCYHFYYYYFPQKSAQKKQPAKHPVIYFSGTELNFLIKLLFTLD